ncbi:MAG TPA: hypothetical protein VNI60_12300 [Pyrinomonadaceae bacterium]|nr:hypothetical protein [Pyrinomonadaceae bacterium]
MENEKEKLRAWVDGWKETGKVLEELRRNKIKAANTITSIQVLDSAYRSAIRNRQTNPTSGLVEFHQLMNRLKIDD